MTPHRSQQQLFLPPAPTNPSSTIRCKTCKAPLPSAAWKNCDNCRRKRTASFHRWKQSAELRKSSSFPTSAPFQTGRMSLSESPASYLCQNGTHRERHPSSLLRTADPSTSSHSQGPASGRSAPLDHGSSDHCPGPSRPTNGRQPRTTTPAAQPLRLQATERQFQRSDELVDALSELAPRSEFIGRFSIVADPAVSNIMQARMFADHLRAKALPISYATSSFCFPHNAR